MKKTRLYILKMISSIAIEKKEGQRGACKHLTICYNVITACGFSENTK